MKNNVLSSSYCSRCPFLPFSPFNLGIIMYHGIALVSPGLQMSIVSPSVVAIVTPIPTLSVTCVHFVSVILLVITDWSYIILIVHILGHKRKGVSTSSKYLSSPLAHLAPQLSRISQWNPPSLWLLSSNLPPPPLLILNTHVDLHPSAPSSSTILAHKDLSKDLPAITHGKMMPSKAFQKPYHKLGTKAHVQPFEASSSDSSDLMDLDLSDSLTSSSDCESANSDELKIHKPDGEPGRPGRGGYNIEEALGWHPNAYKKLRVHISACPYPIHVQPADILTRNV